MGLKFELLTVTLFSALTLSLPALAQGTSGAGGGSTLNGNLIETYAGHSAHELPGYDQAIQQLTLQVPLFAEIQTRNIDAKNIYLIPEGFDQLPKVITALDFNTEVPCYQTTQELFCDSNKLQTMSADQQKNLFVHEAVISAQLARDQDYGDSGPSIADVRAVVAVMIKPGVDSLKVASILEDRQFGDQYSGSQLSPVTSNRSAIEHAALAKCGHYPFKHTPNPSILSPDIPDMSAIRELDSRVTKALSGLGSAEASSAEVDVRNEWMNDAFDKYPTGTVYFCESLHKKYTH
jgi:hypothetical protein